MAKINYFIEPKGFELVRDRIAAILLIELDNQVTFGYTEELDAKIFIERTRPFSIAELPAINIGFGNNNYSNKDARMVDNTCTYFIDVYMGYESDEEIMGDEAVSKNIERLLGMIQTILDHAEYRNLDFSPNFIGTTRVESLQMADTEQKDASNVRMGRATFTVRITEPSTLKNAQPIDGSQTKYKIGTSEEGYLIILE